MLYLSCTTITSVDLAHYRVSRAKDWVSEDCGTTCLIAQKPWPYMERCAVLFSYNTATVCIMYMYICQTFEF